MKRRSQTAFFIAFVLLFFSFQISFAQDVEHESGHTQASFPPLPLEPEIFDFPDVDFVKTALRIQLGIASIQERRAWYRAAERYAPFVNPPANDWKQKAAQQGAQLDPAANGSAPVIYHWSSVGPNGDYDVSRQWGPPGAKNQGRATVVWTDIEGTTVINKNIVFLGFADGGVWKSTDGGNSWTSLIDFQPTLAVGALDVLPGQDRNNYSDAIIYVGTGEGNFSQPDKDGVGVLKSTDGGKTWTVQQIPWRTDELGFAGLHRIRRLRIDRNIPNAQSVWIAADGGVYHTSDGGANWSLVTGLPFSGAPATAPYPGGCWNEFATDLLINTQDKPSGFSTLIAAFGIVNNQSCDGTANSRKNNGIYRSKDGGQTWQKISISAANGFPEIPGLVGRISLLAAPSNPKHIYALIARSDNFNSLGIFDALDSNTDPVQWTAGSTTNFTGQQGWYDITGAVDPTNENRLIVGGIDNWLSNNRGATITRISGWSASDNTWAHADHHHAIWVDANTYYDANDGGLNIGHINGNTITWTHRNSGGLSTLQFYGLSQSATSPYKINAGLQDNGHALFDGTEWKATFGGDGGFAATDQTNENEAYEEYVYAAIRNSDDGGNTWPATGCMQAFGNCTGCLNLCVPDNHAAFITNFMLDVHNQSVMYVGTNYLYRNPDAPNAGKVWQKITSDGVNGDFVNGATSSRAYVSIIHTPQASPVGGLPVPHSQIIYLGTSTGRVWKSTDGGLSWRDLTKAPLPILSPTAGRFVTWIDTDPTDANKVVVTYSGWNLSISGKPGHVFRSVDGGETWTDISGALPDEPFNSVAVNPNEGHTSEIYAASDTGVYVNTNGWSGNTWVRTNSGLLPHVSVNMLQFTNATEPKRLRAATHGRGIWELTTDCEAKVTLDKPSYTCNDTVNITVQDAIGSGPTLSVQVFSNAETSPETIVLTEFPAGSGHYVGTVTTTGGSAVNGDGKITVQNIDSIKVQYIDPTPCSPDSSTITATAITNCSTCESSGASGPNLEVPETPVNLTMLTGDGDDFIDNCENAKVDFTVRNTGSGSLTNVRIVKVTPSNSGVRISGLPVKIASSLGPCATTPASFQFTAGGLSPNETLDLAVEVTSDELAALGVTRTLNLSYASTEQDFGLVASKTFSFENDLEGWEVVQGTFDRTNTGPAAALTSFYLASSSLTDGACDEIRSPVIALTSNSTLSLYNQFAIEPIGPNSDINGTSWFDRANVGIYDPQTGVRTNIAPSGGRTYLADGPNGVCITGGQPGWAGPGPGWLESTWTSNDLLVSQFAGKKIQLDVGYATDQLVSGTGLWFDHVTITNFYLQVPDTQSDDCPVSSCGEIDDSDASIEYSGGWHQKKDQNASGGGYHRRVGGKQQGSSSPSARLVFDGTEITYDYAVSDAGGSADIYIDGAFKQTVSYAGSGNITFGKSVTFSNLGAGSHEILILHRSGIVYVDGFRCGNGRGPDAAAPRYDSETQTSSAGSSEGLVITRDIVVKPGDLEVSIVVEGSSLPLTVKLLDPLGNVIANGGALINGLSFSGLDAAVSTAGTYKIQIPNTLSPGQKILISVARTIQLK